MSYSTVYGLWPNETKRVKLKEFRNSWGMAPVVWNAMAQKYLDTPPHGYMQRIAELWPLHERTDIHRGDRAVLRMTFDTGYILATDVKLAIDDIAIFLYGYRQFIQSDAANHWPAFADVLVTQWKDGPPAFGVHQTSVSENPWDGPYDEEKDERGPFDWSKAFDVYEGLRREPPHD